MDNAGITALGRATRKPWYALWKWVESNLYTGREYTVQVPFGSRVFTPWFDGNAENDFTDLVKRVGQESVLTASPDRTYMLYQFVRRASQLPGDMAECGVYKGGSAYVIASTLAKQGSLAKLDLFDTFDGVPSIADPKRDYHSPGHYSGTSLERVKAVLAEHLDRCRFHAGVIPETYTRASEHAEYSLVHVDVDLYPTTCACCEWFWPRLVKSGVMIFSDYGFYPYRNSTRRAVDEFFGGIGEQPLLLPTGQALAIKMGH